MNVSKDQPARMKVHLIKYTIWLALILLLLADGKEKTFLYLLKLLLSFPSLQGDIEPELITFDGFEWVQHNAVSYSMPQWNSSKLLINCHSIYSVEGAEKIQLSQEIVNPGTAKLGPEDFELKKVLGKGGYGKVFQVLSRFIWFPLPFSIFFSAKLKIAQHFSTTKKKAIS